MPIKLKINKMKKFLLILTLGAFVACNDSASTTTEEKKDSATEATKDKIDSSADAKKDMIDSSAEAKKAMLDSANKMQEKK